MGVHMVRPILGIILQHENGALRPVAALRDPLDDAAQRQIIVRNHGCWRMKAGLGPHRVVARQVDE